MNLQIALLLALIAPLAASGGAGCSPPGSGVTNAAGAPRSAMANDVNGNGVADAYDIATGSLSDEDLDGIPDEAQAWSLDEVALPRG